MDRKSLDMLISREVGEQIDGRRSCELTIKIVFREGGIRQCRSTVEQELIVRPLGS